MKLRQTLIKPINKKKRLNFSAMLNSEYFFHRSNQIQMALNRDRILPKDYLIKRTKPKINTGKKRIINNNYKYKNEYDSSYDSNREKDKKDIPDELENILIKNQKKFDIQNKKYKTIKEYNDLISSYWHYINRTNKKKERELLMKKYFSKDDKNIVNIYSEKIQKSALNIFKSNPLLIRSKNADMFFHYLSEFHKYYQDEDKYIYVKQKIILFLEKLKDFLDYMKIELDSNLDDISKDIKIKNSKYIQEFEIKVQQELENLKEQRRIQNIKDIDESEKMIKKTKKTLKALLENKHLFEESSYFNPYYIDFNKNKYSSKSRNYNFKYKYSYNYNNISNPNITKDNFSPNKTVKMSTVSTGFYIPDKKNNINSINNKNDTKFINDSNKYIKLDNNKTRKSRRAVSSHCNIGHKNYLIKKLQNKPRIKKKIENNSQNSIEVEKNTERDSLSSFDNENEKSNKRKSVNNNLKSEEENIAKIISNKSSSINFKIGKNSKQSSSISINKVGTNDNVNAFRKNNIFIKIKKKNTLLNKNSSNISIESTDKNNRNSLNSLIYKKLFNYNYIAGKDPLGILYEEIKNKLKIKPTDIDKINLYLKTNGKKFDNNLRTMDIILQAKAKMDSMDIENKTKKVFQSYLTYKQIEKLDNMKNVNKKVRKLGIDYMNHIFDFKSKSTDDIQLLI